MLPDPKVRCPATGFAKTCHSIVTKYACPKFVSIKLRNPQTGELIDKYGCIDGFLHLLLIENAQMSRQTGAAVESFRNEVAKAGEAAAQERRDALVAFARSGGPMMLK